MIHRRRELQRNSSLDCLSVFPPSLGYF
ncbi:hypothetical protein E2C01_074668 [Portunus trituberculatus]|uniref:Uncharacterized protein n=1 Tax=Portunus trituberculatus TaxID=210409 RepID=A0A5B7I3W8_PORTR|nr:hypothetical protein [Portunus trituberculatus]